jgi:hypothetical protein
VGDWKGQLARSCIRVLICTRKIAKMRESALIEQEKRASPSSLLNASCPGRTACVDTCSLG